MTTLDWIGESAVSYDRPFGYFDVGKTYVRYRRATGRIASGPSHI
jgi:hypothetical protein